MSATRTEKVQSVEETMQDSDLPEAWLRVSLEEICEPPQYGWTTSAAKDRSGLMLLRTTDISGGEVNWSSVPGCTEEPPDPEKYVLKSGDIVVSRAGSVGVSYLVEDPPQAIFASYLIRFRPKTPIPSSFVQLFLQSPGYWSAIADETAGIAIPNVNASKLKRLCVPLPPLAEQKRIVAKVEELLREVNKVRARLEKVPKILKRFRQSVLAAAFSGSLTEDWREKHPEVEAANSLLLRIKESRLVSAQTNKERTQVLTAFEIAKREPSGKEARFTDTPDSWLACRVGALGSVCNGSTPSRKHPEYWDGNIPWVSSGEVRNNIISKTREQITKEGYKGCSVRLLPKGTVLIAMIGEGKTRGQTAILAIEATINQNIAAILLGHCLIIPEYLWYWFQLQYEATREEGSGTGPQALNCQRVRELPFILSPLEEQREIVRRVEPLFKLSDMIENRVEAATKRANKLTQAILAKAFRGELVPTEAELARQEGRDYEPAWKLLERIKSQRKALAQNTNQSHSGKLK